MSSAQSPITFDQFDSSQTLQSLAQLQQEVAQLPHSWGVTVKRFFDSPIGLELHHFLNQRLQQKAVIFPATPFRALNQTPLEHVRLVILGQDPYHGAEWVNGGYIAQAQGLAFSVSKMLAIPPSLRNILTEAGVAPLPKKPQQSSVDLFSEAENPSPQHLASSWLDAWAAQGVLLLNTSFTVEAGKPASHAGKVTQYAWEQLSDAVIEAVARRDQACVFLLWGAHAHAKQSLIAGIAEKRSVNAAPITVFCANHPSPLAARRAPTPFVGCQHFKLSNEFFQSLGLPPINWQLIVN